MFDTSPQNSKVPTFLQIVTVIECIVLGTTSTVLFFLPALGNQIWAWAIPPFNSRYVGGIYFAALLPLVIFVLIGRWAPGKLVLWMIFAFTTSIGLAMFIHMNDFDWTRPATYAFWFLYIFLPINSAFYLYRSNTLTVAGKNENSSRWRTILMTVTVIFGIYGLGLLIIPETMTSFWPWGVDAFHGRIYAATFLTPALGAWVISKSSATSERFTLGMTLLSLGILSIVGTIWTSAIVPPDRQIDYASLGTWAFFGINIIIALLGAGMVSWARR